jgi:hypothetical protein
MEPKVTGLKVCDVQESRSLHQENYRKYISITLLLHAEVNGQPILPGENYEITKLMGK